MPDRTIFLPIPIEREARAISFFESPARICTLHDVGHEDGIEFLVMEFLEGESLAERLRKGRCLPQRHPQILEAPMAMRPPSVAVDAAKYVS